MPDITPPPFPDDVPTVPLLVIDYTLLQAGDEHEIDRLWKAATELGFWYLKNHGTDAEADAMLEMGAHTMALPLEEKMKFEQGDGGNSFGYKFAGSNATDASGALDSVEFINVSKDDALAFPAMVHRKYPRTVEERMDSALHTPEDYSGSEARCIKKTPASTPEAPDRAAIGAHTDFGSLSFLHNRLGGLQVLPPGTDEWKYVKPIPGHAICNLGDAMAIFSAGILRSNLHRVVPPPKAQASFERWSLVFFTRPGHLVPLAPLTTESTLIAEAAARAPEGRYATGSTAGNGSGGAFRTSGLRTEQALRHGWRAVERSTRRRTEAFAL
ncbi:Clavaminate synthase-like protein [Lactarius pseudohatsudake]|nr:Clavaminate synthase-like protein [Lactarius pseudohatsudake]